MVPNKKVDRLNVFLYGSKVGEVGRDGKGYFFHYDLSGEGQVFSVSLNMPVKAGVYGNADVEPFLAGFLPDGELQRRAIGRDHGVKPSDYIGLLRIMGLDCAGAIQFSDHDSLSDTSQNIDRRMSPLSTSDIARRLKELRAGGEPSWIEKMNTGL